jgi:hypothetical protein
VKGNITFSPVSQSEQIALTRKQLKTLLRIAKATPAAIEVVGHNPSATVEVYEDPVEPATIARRYHLSADGTYDKEVCEVPADDGDWDWGPEEPAEWMVRATRFTQTEPPAKVKKPKKVYLSDKFTIRRNPNELMDDQFQHEEVKNLPLHQVWTVVEGDNGKLYALTGFHIVNKMHYVVTEEEWTDEDTAIDYKY